MSQRQLAHRAAVHPSTVSRVLRGAVPTLPTALALQDALDPSEPSGPTQDAPELHPAILSAMLRRDGFLTNDQIDQLVSLYAELVAASRERAARRPRVRVRHTGRRIAQDVNEASARSSRSC
jgi:transcriptional regulator with XRE-family HTH domain